MVRIILGYLLGFILYFTGHYLKRKHINFSSVLVSGGLAILYFLTYAGHTYYDIFSVSGAFLIMAVITANTVYTAIHFDKEVIAVIGLVGAYAIPNMIRTDNENYRLLFSYIILINSGIPVVSIRIISGFIYPDKCPDPFRSKLPGKPEDAIRQEFISFYHRIGYNFYHYHGSGPVKRPLGNFILVFRGNCPILDRSITKSSVL